MADFVNILSYSVLNKIRNKVINIVESYRWEVLQTADITSNKTQAAARLGIDIGGTDIKFVVVEGRNILCKSKIKTGDTAEKIIDSIANEYGIIKDSFDILSIGAGTPGFIKEGRVTAVNLDFKDLPLAEMLTLRLGQQVTVDNDANCAALGEIEFGIARHCKDMVLMTLGTGVGGGIIINRKICRTKNNSGEVGHIIIQADGGRPCPCGYEGCLEQYASITALCKDAVAAAMKHTDSELYRIFEQNGRISGRTFFDALKADCPVAKAVYDRYLNYLSIGIKSIIMAFGPDAIVLAGGITNEGDLLLDPLKEKVGNTDVEIVISSLQSDAGALGAAML